MAGLRKDATRQSPAAAGIDLGFTLVELLAGLVLLGMLSAWAIPAFGTLARNAERTAQVNQFAQAIYLARSEAIKRNGVVSLCPTLDGRYCSPATNWSTGWIVFLNLDRDSPALRDAGEPLLHAYASWDAGHIAANRSTLSFRPFGQMGVTATVTFCDERGAAAARAVIISQTGRPRVTARNSSGGPLSCI